jgi:hypothetical protein
MTNVSYTTPWDTTIPSFTMALHPLKLTACLRALALTRRVYGDHGGDS